MDVNPFSAYKHPVDINDITVAISRCVVTVSTAGQLWSSMLGRLNLVNVDDMCTLTPLIYWAVRMYFRNRALFVITDMDTVVLLIFCLLEGGPVAELAQLMFSFCGRL